MKCSRCGARFEEQPSCGKVIHMDLPSWEGMIVWQAGIWRYKPPAAERVTEVPEDREAAQAELPSGWAAVEAEDQEAGVWLVIPSPRVAQRLAGGAEYHWRNPKTGWVIDIEHHAASDLSGYKK